MSVEEIYTEVYATVKTVVDEPPVLPILSKD